MSEISVKLGLHENDPKDEPFTMNLVMEEEQNMRGEYATTVIDEFDEEIITLCHEEIPELVDQTVEFLNEHGYFIDGKIRKSGKIARKMYRGLRMKTSRKHGEEAIKEDELADAIPPMPVF
ncbi:MAG: hypothetical protein WBB45_20665 [Cyclobacteriaceae bacterium]